MELKSYSNSRQDFSLGTSYNKICTIDTTTGSSDSGIKEPPFTHKPSDNRDSIVPQPPDLIFNVPVSTPS